jgi:hypothetical protein
VALDAVSSRPGGESRSKIRVKPYSRIEFHDSNAGIDT